MSYLLKFSFLLWIFTFPAFLSPLQAQVDKHQVSTKTIGPFSIGKDHQLKVYARITHVHLRKDESDGWPDSDTSLVVVDSAGKVLFKQSAITTLGGAQTDFGCSQLYIHSLGNVLTCASSISPTVAGDGEQFQLFSISAKGRFVPITSVVGQSYPTVVFLDSRTRTKPILVDSSLSYAKPAIEVQFYTGYYDVKVYFAIYPEGFSEGKHRGLFHFDQIPVVINPKEVERWRKGYNGQATQVLLYPAPEADVSLVPPVTITSSSHIEYLYASYRHDWWLFVSIDGHRGYVSRRECNKLGFPETDGTPVMLGDDY